MNKHDKLIFILSVILLTLLMSLVLLIGVGIVFKFNFIGLLIIIFLSLVVIGFVTIGILKCIYFKYRCPACNELNKMGFVSYLFAHRYQNYRKLTCSKCNKKDYMERVFDE